MKQKGLAALLVLLLILCIPVTAWADVIYPAPGAFTVGEEVNHLLATLDPGSTAWIDPAQLPEGLYLDTVSSEEAVNVYLRGVPAVPGTYDLLFQYNETSTICTLVVLPAEEVPPPVPVAISVDSMPTVTEYTAGDVLDPEGLSLLVEMSDGSSQLVTEGFALYPTRLLDAGTRSIEVNYGGLLCFFDVEVAPAAEVIEGIGVLKLPVKVIYRVGEELDPAGLMIRVYTNNGTRDQYSELLCFPTQFTEPGQQEITVVYEEQTCTFTVQVLAEESAAGLAVYRLPDQTAYRVGDLLDPSGLVLVETDAAGEPHYVEEGYTCEPTSFSEPGSQEITVRLGELSCSFHVTVLSLPVSEPSPAPAVTREPEAAPTVVVITPAPEPQPERLPPEKSGPSLSPLGMLIIAALAALAVLCVQLLVTNRGNRQAVTESLKDLFRRKR